MSIRKFLAASTLLVASTFSHAALQSVPAWNATFPGLSGVQFNVVTGPGNTVLAMGAHPYKNGITMPNDGVSTFSGPSGIYAPDGLGRANWSFDWLYSIDTNACTGCSVWLGIDNDPSSGVNLVYGNLQAVFGNASANSWNLMMGFLQAGYAFNPGKPSSTVFDLQLRNAAGAAIGNSQITVNVPEPGSLALAGMALLMAGGIAARRRKA